MAGVNPYIKPPESKLPEQKYQITYLNGETKEEKVVEVDPAKLPYDRTGLKGSLLEIALGHGIPLDHSCGGVCACATLSTSCGLRGRPASSITYRMARRWRVSRSIVRWYTE